MQVQPFLAAIKKVSEANKEAAAAGEIDSWGVRGPGAGPEDFEISNFSDSETPNFDTSDCIIHQIFITKFNLIWLFISILMTS